MGTRADFYIGRGPDAKWLGSIAWDGYPDAIPESVRFARTEEQYVEALMNFFSERDDVSGPDHGWPWPWNDSTTTDYAYAWDEGIVWGHGHGWFDSRQEEPEDERPMGEFPDMSAVKNISIGGPRDGLIVFQSPDGGSTPHA